MPTPRVLSRFALAALTLATGHAGACDMAWPGVKSWNKPGHAQKDRGQVACPPAVSALGSASKFMDVRCYQAQPSGLDAAFFLGDQYRTAPPQRVGAQVRYTVPDSARETGFTLTFTARPGQPTLVVFQRKLSVREFLDVQLSQVLHRASNAGQVGPSPCTAFAKVDGTLFRSCTVRMMDALRDDAMTVGKEAVRVPVVEFTLWPTADKSLRANTPYAAWPSTDACATYELGLDRQQYAETWIVSSFY